MRRHPVLSRTAPAAVLLLLATLHPGCLSRGPKPTPPSPFEKARAEAARELDRRAVILVPARPVASFAAGTFLENVAAAPDGTLFLNSHLDGRVHRLDPRSGAVSVFATIEGTIAGLALEESGSLLVSGLAGGTTPAVFRLAPDGTPQLLARLEGGLFPNGLTRLAGSIYLVADSHRGAIWQVDATTGTARIWLEHETLARLDPANPVPGVNGLRVHDGVLYASNTQAATLLRIEVTASGEPRGRPKVWVRDLIVDDFAFGVDGALYGTTHVLNRVIRISPKREVTVVAGPAEGVTGCTAATFGAAPTERTTLYVVTNGGLSAPLPGGVRPAQVVALRFGPIVAR